MLTAENDILKLLAQWQEGGFSQSVGSGSGSTIWGDNRNFWLKV